MIFLELSNDPWHYLKSGLIGDLTTASTFTNLMSNFYVVLKLVGLLGCAITLVIAFIKFASARADVRASAKDMVTKKMALVLAIFMCSYVGGWIWGFLANL